jgi:hypothetical protein
MVSEEAIEGERRIAAARAAYFFQRGAWEEIVGAALNFVAYTLWSERYYNTYQEKEKKNV